MSGMFWICVFLGVVLAVLFVGIPMMAVLAWQILKVIFAIFTLLPLQIIRVMQGKPPVPSK